MYSDAWPSFAATTCACGIVGGSSGRLSNSFHVSRNTASAKIVKPSDLWKVKYGMLLGTFGKPTITSPSVPCARSSSTIVQWKDLARLPQ